MASAGKTVATSLAPFGTFLTADVPPDVQIRRKLSSSIVLTIGDDSELVLREGGHERLENAVSAAAKDLREIAAPGTVVIDTPTEVLAGVEFGDVQNYTLIATYRIGGATYHAMVEQPTSKANTLRALQIARSLRRTDSDVAAEDKARAALKKLEARGVRIRETLPDTFKLDAEDLVDDDLKLLADLPFVTWIGLAAPNLTSGCLSHLAQLPHLESLDLDAEQVDGTWLVPLTRFPALRQLLVHRGTVRPQDWSALERLDRLTELRIAVPASQECLVAISRLPRLESLELFGGAGIDDALLAHLRLPKRASFSLSLLGNPVTDASVPYLQQLTWLITLDLSYTKVSADGAARLRGALPGVQFFWKQ